MITNRVMAHEKIVLATGVYDNVDTLADFLDWNLALGAHFVLAYDMGSRDGSQDILELYARRGVLQWSRIPDHNYSRFDFFTQLVLTARAQHRADWVIICDPDEFLCLLQGDLPTLLSRAAADGVAAMTVPRFNMTGPSMTEGENALRRLTLRIDRPTTLTDEQKIAGDLPCPSIFIPIGPKTIVRAAHVTEIAAGAHAAATSQGRQEQTDSLRYLHYPVRGYAHFEAKAQNITEWFKANPELAPIFAWHWRRLVRIYLAGGLRAEYDAQFVNTDRADELVNSGVCTVDKTIATWARSRA
jgi:hypothetical protein